MSRIGSLSILDRQMLFWKYAFKCGVIMFTPWNPIPLRSIFSVVVILAGSPDRALSIGRIGGGRIMEVALEGAGN